MVLDGEEVADVRPSVGDMSDEPRLRAILAIAIAGARQEGAGLSQAVVNPWQSDDCVRARLALRRRLPHFNWISI